MITLHHAEEENFNKNGYGVLDDLIFDNEKGTWELNGEFKISLELPAITRFTEHIKEKNIIQAPVPFMDRQRFRIYRVEKTLDSIFVEAKHTFYDLLDNWIEDTNIVGQNGHLAIQQLLNRTQYPHPFTGSSNMNNRANARMVRMNPVEAILDDGKANTFISRWGGELVRDNHSIEMLERRGSDRGIVIEHRKDLLGYNATIDTSTIVTRIHPVGFDGLTLPEKYIDSPKMDPQHPVIKEIKYSDVKAAVGEHAGDEDAIPLTQAYDELRRLAREEFSVHNADEPETTINVDFVALHNTEQYKKYSHLQEVKAGDTVHVEAPMHEFEITSRLVAFEWSLLRNNHYTSTTLGNHVYEFTSNNTQVDDLRREIDENRQQTIVAIRSANKRNTNYYGTIHPNDADINAREGDLYYWENGEETTFFIYTEKDGELYWREVVSTAVNQEIERRLEEAKELAEKAQTAADDNRKRVDDALGRIDVNVDALETHDDLISEARGIAEGARDQAENIINNSGTVLGLDDINSAIDDIKDPTSNTWRDILASSSGHLVQYTEENNQEVLSSASTQTANQITDALTSYVEESTLDGELTELHTNITTETSELINTTLTDYARHTDLNDFVTEEIMSNEIESTAEDTRQLITNIKNDPAGELVGYNEIINTVDKHTQTIGSDGGSIAQKVMSEELFRESVTNPLNETSTTVDQISDSWALALTSGDDIVTEINATTSGARIAGKNIILDGDVFVRGTFTVTDEVFAEEMNISKFTTGTLNAAEVNLINVNAKNIAGENANLIRASFNAMDSYLTIDGVGLRIDSTYSWDLELNNYGIQVKLEDSWRSAMGRFGGITELVDQNAAVGVGMIANRGSKAVIGFGSTEEEPFYHEAAISVDGTTGAIQVLGNTEIIVGPTTSQGNRFRIVNEDATYVGLEAANGQSGIYLGDNGQILVRVHGSRMTLQEYIYMHQY